MVYQQGEKEEGVWGCVNRERGRRVCGRCAKQGEGKEGMQEGRIKHALQQKNLPLASRKLSQFPPDQ